MIKISHCIGNPPVSSKHGKILPKIAIILSVAMIVEVYLAVRCHAHILCALLNRSSLPESAAVLGTGCRCQAPMERLINETWWFSATMFRIENQKRDKKPKYVSSPTIEDA